jgi:5-methylcytosine-specific restriction endonuclease McrA
MNPCECAKKWQEALGIWARNDLQCSVCGSEVNHCTFRDLPSRKEFKASGLCQKCQDVTFAV